MPDTSKMTPDEYKAYFAMLASGPKEPARLIGKKAMPDDSVAIHPEEPMSDIDHKISKLVSTVNRELFQNLHQRLLALEKSSVTALPDDPFSLPDCPICKGTARTCLQPNAKHQTGCSECGMAAPEAEGVAMSIRLWQNVCDRMEGRAS